MIQNYEGFQWFVLDVNPEPWAVGPVGTGRRNGKVYAYVGQNQQLKAYQEAIKEAIGEADLFLEGPMEILFLFWRRRDEYTTPQARTHRKHEADDTNMVKAAEDALQGVLFKNDKDTHIVHGVVVEQGPRVRGKVVIGIRQIWNEVQDIVRSLPMQVKNEIAALDEQSGNEWPPS